MMRIFFTLLLIFSSLYAKKEDSCYTVQLLSMPSTEQSINIVNKSNYPDSCKVMQISSAITVRCGCFSKLKDANSNLPSLQEKYKYAYIATTYKYRFTQNQVLKVIKKSNTSQSNFVTKEEELKLMLQSFLYTNDLKNAYKTAKIGYKRNPNSYYWNKKMEEVARWSGHGDEAITYMRFMYKRKPSQKLQTDLINHGLARYQYKEIESLVLQKVLQNPNHENIENMIFVYEELGEPQKAALFLEQAYQNHTNHGAYLTRALELYIAQGDLESASRVVQKIQNAPTPYTSHDAEVIAYYYYLKKDIYQAYDALHGVDENNASIKYYELKSDLGWYIHKQIPAAEASLALYEKNATRVADYERIVYVTKDSNLSLLLDLSLEAYTKYDMTFIFYAYANYAINANAYDALREGIEKIATINNPKITQESQYWIIKAQLHQHYKENLLAQEALNHALSLNPDNLDLQLSVLYEKLNTDSSSELLEAINTIADNPDLSAYFYFAIASSYYYLQDVNSASYYLSLAKEENLEVVHSTDFKFLEAYVYQSKNSPNAFYKKMKEIKKVLKKEAKADPKIKETSNYAREYLTASMNTMSQAKFEKKFRKYKSFLTEQDFNNLNYSWALKKGSSEESHIIYQDIDKKELWMLFSNALQQQKHSEIQDLLSSKVNTLPIEDASFAANNDGQIALAQTLVFDALNKNSDSQNAYISHLNLAQQRSNKFTIKPSFYIREPLKQKYIKIKNQNYLDDGYYLSTSLNFYDNETLDSAILLTVPSKTLEVGASVKKVFQRGVLDFDINYHNSMKKYISLQLSGDYKLHNALKAGFILANNITSLESTQLLLGGKKDMIEAKISYNIMPSTLIEYKHQYNRYNSQDDVYLGSGNYGYSILAYQIRNGYPDMRVAAFADFGVYQETEGSRGVIDELQVDGVTTLPEDFYNVGGLFTYGMVNESVYTRVWRPFIELSAYYNSFIDDYSYGFNIGYGGSINHKDHLVVGSSYTESSNGVGDSIFELYLKYEFLY